MTNYSIEEYNTKNNTGNFFSVKGEQTKFQFAPGIIWKMNSKKLILFGGFEAPINLHGAYTLTQDISPNTDDNAETKIPKGYSYGIGAIMGFDYFPAKWLSVGAEFAPSLLCSKLSGTTRTTITSYGYYFETEDEDKGYTYFEQRFSINLSLWF